MDGLRGLFYKNMNACVRNSALELNGVPKLIIKNVRLPLILCSFYMRKNCSLPNAQLLFK